MASFSSNSSSRSATSCATPPLVTPAAPGLSKAQRRRQRRKQRAAGGSGKVPVLGGIRNGNGNGTSAKTVSAQEAGNGGAIPHVQPEKISQKPELPYQLVHVSGDATELAFGEPDGAKVLAHICNDLGRWGKGFVMAINKAFGPIPMRTYMAWHRVKQPGPSRFRLGATQFVSVANGPNGNVTIANMVAQHGIKRARQGERPPIRYEAVAECLDLVGKHAAEVGASVHMPRIGAGLAGGSWEQIERLVRAMMDRWHVTVYVYTFGDFNR